MTKSREKSGPKRPGRGEAKPEKLTEDSLREAALGYLDRQDASVKKVRDALFRRIEKYGDDETRPPARALVEPLLERLRASGLIDDARFARQLSEGQRRRGASLPKIRAKLRARGISDEDQESALAHLGEDEELSDEASAGTYAKKRRLAERYDLNDPKQRNKALAALARQGFSFDVAKKVLGL